MLTAKKALEKQNFSDDKQLVWKIYLIRKLKEENYTNDQIHKLLYFIRSYIKFKDKNNNLELNNNIIQNFNLPKSMGIIELFAKKREEQIEELKAKGKIEGIKKLLQRGKLTIEEIAEDLDVTIDFVLDIQKTL